MNNDESIRNYLQFGYLPTAVIPEWIGSCITKESKGCDYYIEEVNERLDLLFDTLLEKYGYKNHVVPLSGGWDSRLILGALIERVDVSSIQTVTFGIPGQLDYEIAKKISMWAGVKHHSINLNSVPFTWKSILKSVESSKWTYVPDGYYNQICRNFIQSHVGSFVWIGFGGGAIVGSHLIPNKISNNLLVKKFLNKQERSDILPGTDNNRKIFINNYIKGSSPKNLSLLDALEFGLRQVRCIYPIVSPNSEMKNWGAYFGKEVTGNEILAPFAEPIWAGYWLSAPRKERLGMNLYHKAIESKFPELFSLPSKSLLGFYKNQKTLYRVKKFEFGIRRRLQKIVPFKNLGPHSTQNYLDYDKAYRERSDFQETLKEAFSFLEEIDASPWLDFGKMWNEHNNFKCNHGQNFNLILGLAANMKMNGLIKEI